MGHTEVFGALQTGVIDGAENNPPTLFTSNQYTTVKYYTQTNHLIIPEIFVMSKVTWDKLSPGRTGAGEEVLARGADGAARRCGTRASPSTRAKLKAAGIEFIDIDNKPFYDATAPVRAKYGAQYADLMKRIEDVK